MIHSTNCAACGKEVFCSCSGPVRARHLCLDCWGNFLEATAAAKDNGKLRDVKSLPENPK